MPDLLLHLVIPLAALLLLYDTRYRTYILLLCPLAILPDIDHLWSGEYARVWLHNVFILLPPLFVGLYAYTTGRKKAYNVALIAIFYLCSHLLLDMFQGGISLLYPLAGYNYAVTFDLLMQNHNVTPNIAFIISMPSRSSNVEGGIVSSVTAAIAVIFLVLASLRALLARKA